MSTCFGDASTDRLSQGSGVAVRTSVQDCHVGQLGGRHLGRCPIPAPAQSPKSAYPCNKIGLTCQFIAPQSGCNVKSFRKAARVRLGGLPELLNRYKRFIGCTLGVR